MQSITVLRQTAQHTDRVLDDLETARVPKVNDGRAQYHEQGLDQACARL